MGKSELLGVVSEDKIPVDHSWLDIIQALSQKKKKKGRNCCVCEKKERPPPVSHYISSPNKNKQLDGINHSGCWPR